MPFIDVNGRQFHYQTAGNPEGKPLVFIHGLTGNLAALYLLGHSPELQQYRVLLYDQKGHGKSASSTKGYDLDSLSNDLNSLLQQLGIAHSTFQVLGHSYGAAVALKFTLAYPSWVRKLILVDPVFPPLESALKFVEGSWSQRLRLLPEDANELLHERPKEAKRLISNRLNVIRQTSMIQDAAKEVGFCDADLSQLASPVLLITATGSRFLNEALFLERNTPDLTVRNVEGTHHNIVSQPAQTAAYIKEFLDG